MSFLSTHRFAGAAFACILALSHGLPCNATEEIKQENQAVEPPAAEEEKEEGKPLEVTTKGGPEKSSLSSLAQSASALMRAPDPFEEGLEGDVWRISDHHNKANWEKVSLKTKDKKEHKRLALELKGGPKAVTMLSCEGAWLLSLQEKAATTVQIYLDGKGAMKCSIAFCYGEKFKWYETPTQTMNPGWNTLRFDQTGKQFKGGHSDWQSTERLPKKEECRAIFLIFHNHERTARVYLDTILPALDK